MPNEARMKWIIVLLISWGCSHTPVRSPSAVDEKLTLGEFDLKKSVIRLFEDSQLGDDEFAFYIEAKNENSSLIDFTEDELKITHSGHIIPFSLQRLSRGTYILSLEIFSLNGLKIFVQNKQIKHNFSKLPAPSKHYSSMLILKQKDHELKLQLTLRDKHNRPVISPISPDILIDGLAKVEDLKEIGPGEWSFRLIFPEQSQVFYLSVRSNGGYLAKIFRFHYVEK